MVQVGSVATTFLVGALLICGLNVNIQVCTRLDRVPTEVIDIDHLRQWDACRALVTSLTLTTRLAVKAHSCR